MSDTIPAEKLLEVLGELHSVENAGAVLTATLCQELQADGVALFRYDDEASCLTHTPNFDGDSLGELVGDCVASRSLSRSGEAVALPLVFEGIPVGALVSCGATDALHALSNEARNLAALLARVAGGGIPGYLSPSQFLVEIRREEERTLRFGHPFAVVSVDRCED